MFTQKWFALGAGLLMAASVSFAADKTYQVTGPVLEMSDSEITVEKGKEKWVLGRDASTKVNGDLKVGAKVTIKYKMTATDVEVKSESAAPKASAAPSASASPAAAAASKTPKGHK